MLQVLLGTEDFSKSTRASKENIIYVGVTNGHGYLKVNSSLEVISKTGKNLIYAGSTDDGDGLLTVKSKTGKDVLYAGGDVDGNGFLSIKSKTGEDVLYAGGDVDGNGFLSITSKTGVQLIHAGASSSGNGAFMSLTNRTGERSFSYMPTTMAMALWEPTTARVRAAHWSRDRRRDEWADAPCPVWRDDTERLWRG